MKILLTNDDGIYAKGIEVLQETLSIYHDVHVVAPETEQSAVGHAITWLDPLRISPVQRNGKFFGYGLTGTPADCVKIAVAELLPERPDIVVSGVNAGLNVGVNIIYSGTVSAATEAALLGIPSIAVSIDAYQGADYSGATAFIRRLVDRVSRNGLPAGVSLNVNVPNLPPGELKGVRVTHQGMLQHVERYDRRIDPREHVYYWLANSSVLWDDNPDSDSKAVSEGFISVTPLQHDLTNHSMIDSLKRWGLQEG